MAILSLPRRPEAGRSIRGRYQSDSQPLLAELDRDRLAWIVALAERAGIRGPLPGLFRDARLVGILAAHFRVPSPSIEACRRYYHEHQDEFREPDRYVGRQIVLPFNGEDAAVHSEIWARAERLIAILSFSPRMFPDLLASFGTASDTSGQLGPVARGALPGPLDAMFFALRPGEICPAPILTEHGVHVVMLDRIVPGEPIPFATMHGRVRFLLRQETRRAAAARHLARLADRYRAATAPAI